MPTNSVWNICSESTAKHTVMVWVLHAMCDKTEVFTKQITE